MLSYSTGTPGGILTRTK